MQIYPCSNPLRPNDDYTCLGSRGQRFRAIIFVVWNHINDKYDEYGKVDILISGDESGKQIDLSMIPSSFGERAEVNSDMDIYKYTIHTWALFRLFDQLEIWNGGQTPSEKGS